VSTLSKSVATLREIARVCGTRTALAYLYGVVVTLPDVMRCRNLDSADRRMSGRRWPYRVQGVSFELDGRYFGGAREMYCRQVYFPTPAFVLNPGTTVVDLGANVGLFSILCALAGCKVIAVEAQSGLIHELTHLASSFGVGTRIIAENALVGSGTGLLSDHSVLAAASHFEGRIPPRVSMTELLAKNRTEFVDFLKVDIEGSEFSLFQSGDRWLRQIRRIAMEVHTSFGSVAELKGMIESQGMSVELRDNERRVVRQLPTAGGYLFATR
jgi:FkbM family methyltransferase